MSSGAELISELSSQQRVEILKLLSSSHLKASEIAKNLDTSIQAVSRHIDRLNNVRLIEKSEIGTYRLTTVGNVILKQYPFFEFLEKFKDYFETHDFTGIPDYLLIRLGDLANCEFEPNSMKSLQRSREWCMNMKKYLKAATYTTPLEYFDVVDESMKNGATQQMVFGTNSVFPKGFSELYKKRWAEYLKSGQAKIKIVKHVPIVLGLTENEAQLVFTNKKFGCIDANGIFFSKDLKFMKWCQDLFDYYWNMPEIENYTLIEQ